MECYGTQAGCHIPIFAGMITVYGPATYTTQPVSRSHGNAVTLMFMQAPVLARLVDNISIGVATGINDEQSKMGTRKYPTSRLLYHPKSRKTIHAQRIFRIMRIATVSNFIRD
jgi:hypothetical protein